MLAVPLTSISLEVMPCLFIPLERTHKVRNTGVGGVCSFFRFFQKKRKKTTPQGGGFLAHWVGWLGE